MKTQTKERKIHMGAKKLFKEEMSPSGISMPKSLTDLVDKEAKSKRVSKNKLVTDLFIERYEWKEQ